MASAFVEDIVGGLCIILNYEKPHPSVLTWECPLLARSGHVDLCRSGVRRQSGKHIKRMLNCMWEEASWVALSKLWF